MDNMRIAIFDLGSTSFHVLVVDIDADKTMHRVFRDRRTLHLGAAAAVNGHIPSDAASTALRTARLLRKRAETTRPDMVIASATSALRDASNGGPLLELLSTAVATPIRVLGGAEEAELAYRGAVAGLGISGEPVIVADLGGGSLDIAAGFDDDVDLTATFPLGASRMTALHIESDPPHLDELEAIEAAVERSCADVFAELRARGPMRCIVAGGTGRAVGRLVAAKRGTTDAVDGLTIPTAELHEITRTLTTMNRKKRSRLDGINTKRVDVLPAGALTLSCLADGLDAGAVTISEWGLREGQLLEVAEHLHALAS